MTDDKNFIAELTAAATVGDKRKCAMLMASKAEEHIRRIHIEKISSLEAPCLVAAVMMLNKLYLSSFDTDTIEIAKTITDSLDITGVRFETSIKAGDIDV